MRGIYKEIKILVTNGVAWWLDYAYVTFWQVYGFFVRSDFTHYLKPEGSQNKTPIILIPGIYENWRFMKPIADLLYTKGYPVHVISALGYNRADVDTMAHAVKMYIAKNQLTNFSIVAHSKGGLIAKSVLISPEGSKIKGIVALNTPFGGSNYAYLTPLKSLRIFLPNSPVLQRLSKATAFNNKIVSIYGLFDPHIPKGSYLKGARNIQLNTRGHFRIMNNPETHDAIVQAIKSFQD